MRYIVIFLLVLLSLNADDELRTWTSNVGTTIKAKLAQHSREQLSLVTEAGKVIKLKPSDLSSEDQEYLKALARKEAGTEIKGVDAKPGKLSGVIKCIDSEWSYHVYLPKNFHLAQEWPVCFVMSASGGRGGSLLNRYRKAADHFGIILIGSVESKNLFKKSQAAVEATAKDVYARFPVAEKFAFASGNSGGSRMSYLLSEGDSNVVAILACGSGEGVYPDGERGRPSKLRPGTYVYSLIGTNCFNRTEAYQTHQNLSSECRLRFFPGKHVWAGEDLLLQGSARILGEMIASNRDLKSHEGDYLVALEKLILDLEASAPWESHYLADFGAGFNKSATIKKLAQKLAGDAQVKLATEAEEDIDKLCAKFYLKYGYSNGDTKDLPARDEMGKALAEKYTSIPHGKVLSLLGEKSPAP